MMPFTINREQLKNLRGGDSGQSVLDFNTVKTSEGINVPSYS